MFFDVSYQSYLPSIVDRDQLVDGNSKLEISQSAAQIVGPGIAGVLIGLLKAPFAIVLDSLSFVWSAFFVFLIRRPEPPVAHDPATRRPEAVDASGDRRGPAVRPRPPLRCGRSRPPPARRTSSATSAARS